MNCPETVRLSSLMSEELNLVRDLAVILISAGIFTIISKALKQPLILGYIIAGFLIGPHIGFFPGISSQETVHQWSEIGIIFLMFGLGLEFSFKKLMKVGSSAIVTGLVKFVGVFIIGFVTSQALGWTAMESVFLGGLLSMSSTMVVIKSYDDMGLKDKPYAGMVFGTLVVEDLIAILLMVLLSTMAVSQSFAGKELVANIAKLVFFLLLWFLVGIFVIREHIDKIVEPIKNLFGAIFFVSVGMMLAPAVIVEHWALILLITVIVIVTHIVFAGAGMIITGNSLYNSAHTGFSLAQLGEFGFILAGVGCTLGVMRDFIYPVIIAVSVITTFTTPYMIKLADPFLDLMQRKLPKSWLERLQTDRGNSTKQTAAEINAWKDLLTAWFTRHNTRYLHRIKAILRSACGQVAALRGGDLAQIHLRGSHSRCHDTVHLRPWSPLRIDQPKRPETYPGKSRKHLAYNGFGVRQILPSGGHRSRCVIDLFQSRGLDDPRDNNSRNRFHIPCQEVHPQIFRAGGQISQELQ